MTPMGSGMGGMSSGSLGGSGLYGGPPPPGRLGAGSASLGNVGVLQQQRQQQMQSPSLLGGARWVCVLSASTRLKFAVVTLREALNPSLVC